MRLFTSTLVFVLFVVSCKKSECTLGTTIPLLQNWNIIEFPLVDSSQIAPQILDFSFISLNEGVQITKEEVFFTSDRGVTWLNTEMPLLSGESIISGEYYAGKAWVAIDSVLPGSGNIFSKRATLLMGHKGINGFNWYKNKTQINGLFKSVHFADSLNGFGIVLTTNLAYKTYFTTDGGFTWTQGNANTVSVSESLNWSYSVIDRKKIAFLDVFGEIWSSNDCGKNWASHGKLNLPVYQFQMFNDSMYYYTDDFGLASFDVQTNRVTRYSENVSNLLFSFSSGAALAIHQPSECNDHRNRTFSKSNFLELEKGGKVIETSGVTSQFTEWRGKRISDSIGVCCRRSSLFLFTQK